MTSQVEIESRLSITKHYCPQGFLISLVAVRIEAHFRFVLLIACVQEQEQIKAPHL